MILEFDIVRTTFDPRTQCASYTVRRNDKHWTVIVQASDFSRFGKDKAARRAHLSERLRGAMSGPADEDKVA